MTDTDGMDVGGSTAPRFEPVREVFAGTLSGQGGTGAAVAAWWDGALVLDMWGGQADASRRPAPEQLGPG